MPSLSATLRDGPFSGRICAITSFAAAGFWEIYEFTMDQLAGTNMQGNNLNTMGDIVSGFLGGLVYGGVAWAVRLSRRRKQRSIRAGI